MRSTFFLFPWLLAASADGYAVSPATVNKSVESAEGLVSAVPGPTTRDEAIAAVLAEHPKLTVYRTASLPPHSIEAKRGPSGEWAVAFVRSGSGIDSILDAQCFRVGRFGEVAPAGTFRRMGRDVRNLDLATCRPR